jgi:3-deoxy-D-manno-octulosonic-acid transferase
MYLLYNLFLTVSIIFILPWWLLNLTKGKYRAGFWQRMGFYPDEIKRRLLNQSTIWIHAVSVGEVIASAPLIKELKKRYPDFKIILSTVTVTGNRMANKKIKEADYIVYFPFDFLWSVRKALNSINPVVCLIIETELWPNFLRILNLKGIPAIIVNGRISEKSFRGYMMARVFMKYVLKNIRLFSMQTDEDAEKVIDIGADKNNVKVTGNIKYDHEFKQMGDEDINRIRVSLGLKNNDEVFIAGSTHSGEEEIIIGLYLNVLKHYPALRLLIAPRHIERVGDVEEIVKKMGLNTVRKTAISKVSYQSPATSHQSRPVIILDTIGELGFMYSIATIVFVGGSLIPHGGQNVLEPAFYKRPVIFGKYMMNFKEVAADMVSSGGGIQVGGEMELKSAVEGLLDDREKMTEIGEKGYRVIIKNRGALQKNLELIEDIINQKIKVKDLNTNGTNGRISRIKF